MEGFHTAVKASSAWKQAVLEHCPWLKTFIGSRLSQGECIDDILQETLQSALAEQQPEKVENVQAWLTGIARHKILQYQRNQVKQRSISARFHQEGEMNGYHEASPLHILVHKERDSLVNQALEHLTPQEAELMRWKYIEGWSYEQIGKARKINHHAVTNQLRSARKKLRQTILSLSSNNQPKS